MRKSMYSQQTCGVGLRLVATRCLRELGIRMLYLVLLNLLKMKARHLGNAINWDIVPKLVNFVLSFKDNRDCMCLWFFRLKCSAFLPKRLCVKKHTEYVLNAAVSAEKEVSTVQYTAKKLIGNRLSRLKNASLLIKYTISSRGICLATHSMLLYIIDSKKTFPTTLMGENPWYQRENGTPRLWWEMPTIYRKILMPGLCREGFIFLPCNN